MTVTCIDCGTELQDTHYPSVTAWWCPTCDKIKEIGR